MSRSFIFGCGIPIAGVCVRARERGRESACLRARVRVYFACVCVFACVRAFVRVCVCACVRACVRVFVRCASGVVLTLLALLLSLLALKLGLLDLLVQKYKYWRSR